MMYVYEKGRVFPMKSKLERQSFEKHIPKKKKNFDKNVID